jgi:hypothetical protein
MGRVMLRRIAAGLLALHPQLAAPQATSPAAPGASVVTSPAYIERGWRTSDGLPHALEL